MRCSKTAVLTLISFSIAAGIAAAQQTMPALITPQQSSGMVGIVAGQTARLNALHPGVPAPLATGARCPVQVSFVDADGNVLKTGQLTVDPGKSLNFDFPMSTSGRLEIRALISFTQPAASTGGTGLAIPVSVCNLIPTLEILDSTTLKTEAVLTDFRMVAYPLFTPGIMTGSMPPRQP